MVPAASDAASPRATGAPSRGARSFVLVVLVGLLIASAVLFVTAVIEFGSVEALLCLGGAAALGVVMLPILIRNRYDLFEPITFVILAATVGVVLKAPYVVFARDDPHVRDYVLLGRPPSFLTAPMVIVLIGLTALVLGYLVRVPRLELGRLPIATRTRWDGARLAVVLSVCAVVGVASMLLYLERLGVDVTSIADMSSKRFVSVEGAEEGDYGYTALGYYRWGASLVQVAFYVLLAYCLTRRKPLYSPAWVALAVIGLLSLAFPVFNGSRTGMVMLLVNAAIIVYYLNRGISVRSFLTTCAIALAGILVVTALRRGADDFATLRTFFKTAPVLRETVGSRHFLDLAKTGHIIAGVPDKVRYRYGETFVNWVVAPVPRTLWPGKPTLGSGPQLGPAIFDSRRSGVPPGLVAELYMNFGILGVPVGMFLVGLLLRFVYVSFRPYLSHPSLLLFYTFIVVSLSFSLLSNDFSKIVVSILKDLVPVYVVLLLVTRRPVVEAARAVGPSRPTAGALPA